MLLATYLLGAAALVLSPSGPDSTTVSVFLYESGMSWLSYEAVQQVGNVVLFVPITLLAALILPERRMWLLAPASLVGSVAIEVVQAAFLPARWGGDISDIVANTLGGVIGLTLAYLVRRTNPEARHTE